MLKSHFSNDTRKGWYKSVCLAILASALLLSGCKTTPNATTNLGTTTQKPNDQLVTMKVNNDTAFQKQLVHIDKRGDVWIPVERAGSLLGLKVRWSGKSRYASFGHTDPLYELEMGNRVAHALGAPVQLTQAPRWIHQKAYMAISSVGELFGTDVLYEPDKKELRVVPIDDRTSTLRKMNRMMSIQPFGTTTQPTTAPTVNRQALVAMAAKLKGTPYAFGSKAFTQTGTFDCSSYTQYVFSKYGVSLPRSSRAQAQVGKEVERTSLKPGDLLFFYTPGRFSSNQIVGHVGIYAGNQQFWHTYGKPGVTMNSLADSRWSNRLLFSKRVVTP